MPQQTRGPSPMEASPPTPEALTAHTQRNKANASLTCLDAGQSAVRMLRHGI